MAKVALVKGESRNQNIHDALSLIKDEIQAGLKDKKKVLIKPNLTAIDNVYANTDVCAIETVIDFINGLKDVEIIIGESSGGAYYAGKSTQDIFNNFGYGALVEKYSNVNLVDFDGIKEYTRVRVETIHGKEEIKVMKPSCDYSISLAIPKTHDYTIATLSLKNMMGLVAREDRLKIHGLSSAEDITHSVAQFVPMRMQYFFKQILPQSIINLVKNKETYRKNVCLIHKNLFALFNNTIPDLSIIDGYYGMQGDGPISGEGIKHGIAIAGLDPVKTDAVGALCMGFKPDEIGYLHYCAEEGLGSIEIENELASSIEKIAINYKPHREYENQKKWKG